MMTLEQVQAKLGGVHIPDVARETGLVYNTIKNVKIGRGVRYETVEVLSRYFTDKEKNPA